MIMMDKPKYASQFGNLVGLRPDNNNNIKYKNNNNNKTTTTTKTMEISEQLYERFLDHSRRYYNVETYETILKNLLDCFDKHNEDKR
jgi:hypothetical protein